MNGRRKLLTEYPFVDSFNLIDVLQKVMPDHMINQQEMAELIAFEKNEQEPIRKKTFRPDIDNFIPDPISSYITDFKCGFEWGNPITFVQSDDDDVEDNDLLTRALSLFNQCYRTQNIKKKQQKILRKMEICGLGYSYVDINTDYDAEMGDSPFIIEALDPIWTIYVRSTAYLDQRCVLAGTYRKDKSGLLHMTLFTPTVRFDCEGQSVSDLKVKMIANTLGMIPIVEWERSDDRMGCFERLIPQIEGLTLAVSDFLNDVDQNTQAIWWAHNVEFPTKEVEDEEGNVTEEVIKPKNGEWLNTESPKDETNSKVQPLTIPYDYNGMLENISSTRSYILGMAHVPQRNDNSGGSTGVAMDSASGWTDAEAEACRKAMYVSSSKMEEARLALKVCHVSPLFRDLDSPLLSLRYSDIEPNFKRSKTYDLTTKINAICTGLSHGFALEDLLANVPLFEDNSQVVARSGAGVRKYQDTIYNKDNEAEGAEGEQAVNSDRLQADLSDEISQSPNIGNA